MVLRSDFLHAAAFPCCMRNRVQVGPTRRRHNAGKLAKTRALADSYIVRYKEQMSERTALIISCSREQAATIHQRAALERRTVSAYVLRVLMRWLDLEERLVLRQEDTRRPLTAYQPVHPPGKRTTMLIRCSKEEAQRIRAGAKRRSTTISWYVVHTLALARSAEDLILTEFRQN